jgi:hypothetical protein
MDAVYQSGTSRRPVAAPAEGPHVPVKTEPMRPRRADGRDLAGYAPAVTF